MRKFISYYPLKQGLKPLGSNRNDNAPNEFISYYPLKQGLKPYRQKLLFRRLSYLYPTIH